MREEAKVPALSVRVAALGPAAAQALEAALEAVRGRWGGGSACEAEGAVVRGPAGLRRAVRRWCDREGVGVVLTVGRSGPAAGDFAPAVTAALLDRRLPGVEERMYLGSPRRPEDLLFRGVAGIRRGSIVVNLPDRPARLRAVLGFLAPVVPHALAKIGGDPGECSAPPEGG